MKRLLVTGSSGLIGSEVCAFFAERGWELHGIDNNQRAVFFGPEGDTRWNQRRLKEQLPRFEHHEYDVRDRDGIGKLVAAIRPDAVVHTAAQPSHDKAAQIPFDDFDTNAVGTLNLLEGVRRLSTEIPFVHFSTNKVYGDAPNSIRLRELATRWDYADPEFEHGIPETFRIDQSKHSLFGASKVAADVLVQEYGRDSWHADRLFARGVPDRPEPQRRPAPWFSELPRPLQRRGARIHHLRLQGQAGA